MRFARKCNNVGDGGVCRPDGDGGGSAVEVRETTGGVEGRRGNRGKEPVSRRSGISRRYRAKPYAPQNRQPHFSSHLATLSPLPHPDRRTTRSDSALASTIPRDRFRARSRLRKNAIDSAPPLADIPYSTLTVSVIAAEFGQLRDLRARLAVTVNLRDRARP